MLEGLVYEKLLWEELLWLIFNRKRGTLPTTRKKKARSTGIPALADIVHANVELCLFCLRVPC